MASTAASSTKPPASSSTSPTSSAAESKTEISSNTQDTHLAIFVHGLWGNPVHLDNLSNALRTAFPTLRILVAKRNTGYFTYDGIELGAERVTSEVEEELESLKKDGKTVTKVSFIGYSMGGLVARYCVGLLYSKGLLGPAGSGKIEPLNFTTFASPHIGTRTPLLGWHNNVWNALGARSLSASGNQMWTIDSFRDTGRPLLAVLADPQSIFMKALRMFRRRSLYANIVNDRAVAFYTAYISDIDPFPDPSALDIHYEPGYEDVILKPSLATPKDTPATFAERSSQIWGKVPFYFFVGTLAPIGGLVFLGSAAVQSFQSAQRIKQHESGGAGIKADAYRFPLLESAQQKVDQALERVNSAGGQDYLDEAGKKEQAEAEGNVLQAEKAGGTGLAEDAQGEKQDTDGSVVASVQGTVVHASDIPSNPSPFPTLALTKEQFEMKRALDDLGFDKYAVHIKNVGHSHAAIVRRTNRAGFSEGKVVARHWTERFET